MPPCSGAPLSCWPAASTRSRDPAAVRVWLLVGHCRNQGWRPAPTPSPASSHQNGSGSWRVRRGSAECPLRASPLGSVDGRAGARHLALTEKLFIYIVHSSVVEPSLAGWAPGQPLVLRPRSLLPLSREGSSCWECWGGLGPRPLQPQPILGGKVEGQGPKGKSLQARAACRAGVRSTGCGRSSSRAGP